MSLAHLVFGSARAVLYRMHQVVCKQECEGAEDGRAVHRVQFIVQFSQRHSPFVSSQSTKDEEAGGRSFHATALHSRNQFFIRHVPVQFTICESANGSPLISEAAASQEFSQE